MAVSSCLSTQELSWRDFFRFYAGKHGVSIFQEGGVKGYRRRWMQDERIFKLWSQGRTGASTPCFDMNIDEQRSFKGLKVRVGAPRSLWEATPWSTLAFASSRSRATSPDMLARAPSNQFLPKTCG